MTSNIGSGYALRHAHERRASTAALRIATFILLVLVQAGCGMLVRKPPPPPAAQMVTPFSVGRPGGPWPGTWHEERVLKLRKPTSYALVDDDGTTVVEAIADASASGVAQFLDIDPSERPILAWRWKVTQPVAGADTTQRSGEDAAVRVMVAFAGDVNKLPFSDKLFFEQAKALTGVSIPYATVEYVWGSGAPKDTVVINSYTSRIRMLLVESGEKPLGQWVSESRDVVKDYQRIFKEEPGRIVLVAIYTDADATAGRAHGYFGDISLLTREEAALREKGGVDTATAQARHQ